MPSKTDLVRSYFGAYRSKDRALVERLLTDDFTFTSPYDDAIDKSEYFIRCWPSSERRATNALETIVEHGDDALVQYKCVTTDGKEFRNVEILTFDGERIREVNVYFGAAYKDGKFLKQQ